MHVLLLAHSLGIGGAERQLVNLAIGLHREGHQVEVAAFYGGGALQRDLDHAGIPVIDLRKSGRWHLVAFAVRLVRLVRRLRPQIVYAFLGAPNVAAVLLKLLVPRIRVVWGVRSSLIDFDHYDWLHRATYRVECLLSRFADLIICNSRAGLEYAAAHGFPRGRMVVVPNGISVDRFRPDVEARARVRAEWGITESQRLIGVVGRLDAMKDHPTFLRAAAELAARRPEVRFVVVGDGPDSYASQLQSMAAESGVQQVVRWAGARHDMPAVYSAFDVACLSSCGEGFPNVVAEAMSCGVPCVVTDVGDAALVVGETGIVVPVGQPAALADALEVMIGQLGVARSACVRESIVSRFTEPVLVAHTLGALESVLGTGAAA